MRPRSLDAVAAATGGAVVPREAGPVQVARVTVNSRTAGTGALFVALPGDASDGHDHVPDAFRRGAEAAIVSAGRIADRLGPVVEVADPGSALLDLARDERSAMAAVVVGITGSTGKTITKDFTAAVLATRHRVVASQASFNNEVGLPLTLLSADEDTKVVVCEMGSRGLGHIRLLCDVARPSIGVVTNVGVAHMELFGSREALRNAKAELPEALPPDGTAVLNADDPVTASYAARTAAHVLRFGLAGDADVRADRIEIDRTTGRASFDLVSRRGRAHVTLPAPGEHLVADALAAAAVGVALDMNLTDAAEGLARAKLSGGRMEVIHTPSGLRLINDAYNANPSSMAAALKAARWMAGAGRCVAVLGVMAELGPIAAEEHERIGELVARLGIRSLVVVGEEARLIALGAAREGVEPDRISVCADVDEAVQAVRRLAGEGDLILVKGSRVARLERVVDALAIGADALEGAGT